MGLRGLRRAARENATLQARLTANCHPVAQPAQATVVELLRVGLLHQLGSVQCRGVCRRSGKMSQKPIAFGCYGAQLKFEPGDQFVIALGTRPLIINFGAPEFCQQKI